jgi:hypothetical protein
MGYLTPYYELGDDTPTFSCSCFESIQRFVAEDQTPLFERVTLADMQRVGSVTIYHDDDCEMTASTWDGQIVGTWGDKPSLPIDQYRILEAAQWR